MIPEFERLSAEEKDYLLKVPALVTMLIAGADNKIDRVERNFAYELTKYKTMTGNLQIREYYSMVNEIFPDQLDELIKQYPKDLEQRQQMLEAELAKINEIMAKFDSDFAYQYYLTIKDIARYISDASGGIWGYVSKTLAEKEALASLDMILSPKVRQHR